MRAARPALWVAIKGGEAVLAAEPDQLVEDGVGGFLIQVAGRLVRQQQHRLVGDGAGDGDALLFAAREPGRAVREPGLQTEPPEKFAGPRSRRCRLSARRSAVAA